MFNINVLASGSSGNCIYVETDSKLLFDAGKSGRYIKQCFDLMKKDINDVKALFVSHEHRDHISGVGIINRRHNIPLYMNRQTLNESKPVIGKVENIKFIDGSIKIGKTKISQIKTSHDAVKPSGYLINYSKKNLAIITDTGKINAAIRRIVKRSNALVLETNHDPDMLRNGPYPEFLKDRIESDKGHLSNFQASNIVCESASDKLKTVFLAHLSENNNTPKIAYDTFKQMVGYRKDLKKLNVVMTDRYRDTGVFKI